MTEIKDWVAPVTLTGPALTLRPLSLDDAEQYLAALGSPAESASVVEHLSVAPTTVEQTRQVITTALDEPARLPLAQTITATGEFIGSSSFYDINSALRTVAIGHTWIARRYWRSGVNTESKLIMMTHAFEDLGVERLVWHTDIRNTRSQDAIERLGAQREGVLRHHRIRRDGSWRDTVQFSMLAAEWPAAKTHLSGRLNS